MASDIVAEHPAHDSHSPAANKRFWLLLVGSLGVVYGDIGTSPLYAFREAVKAAGPVEDATVLGVLSLILWALVLVVTCKYVLFLLRADNHGEGGILALMALAQRSVTRGKTTLLLMAIVGAALFYGDAMITPAISVLSAVEGLHLVTPTFDHLVLPLAVAIIVGLFLVQSRGTARVSAFFGPVMIVWFVVIAAIGVVRIAGTPEVLAAVNPLYGAGFLAGHGFVGFLVLGGVFLAVTGAEALYADLGHFGRRAIQTAWLGLAGPALCLNYLGQGAFLLENPEAIENPFYLMLPGWALVPMVILATGATVIASQAVISGAFSLSRQAVQLGLLPRLEVRHTSAEQAGQVFLPRINLLLLLGVLLLVAMFRTSGALAVAYGIAVTGTMVITALMAFVVVRSEWRWGTAAALALVTPFLVIDLTFLAANLFKIADGGWAPQAIAALIAAVIITWRRGSRILFEKTRRAETPLADLVGILERRPPPRVAGTAVYLSADPQSAPTALLHSLKHFKVLHERNIVLAVEVTTEPRVKPADRVTVQQLGDSFWRVELRYGFMESPNVPAALRGARIPDWKFDMMSTSFFLSRRTIRPSSASLPGWQHKLFIVLARNADRATDYFRIPTDRVVEIGTHVTV